MSYILMHVSMVWTNLVLNVSAGELLVDICVLAVFVLKTVYFSLMCFLCIECLFC